MTQTSQPKLKWIRRVSQLLDSKFTIPSTSIKFGIDPILGIIPGIGDLSSYIISLFIIYTAKKKGGSGELLTKMMLNSSIDALIGSIPIFGTVFDIWYKANVRNLTLAQEHFVEGKHQGTGKGLMLVIILSVIAIITALVYMAWWVLVELSDLLAQ